MRILITGMTGHFGTLLAERLRGDPDVEDVIGISSEAIEKIREDEESERIKFYYGDTRKKRVEEIFQKNKNIDAIVHLAYYTRPVYDKKIAHETNVFGTMRMLQLAKKHKVKKFIYPSSAVVYGALPDNPALLREDYPLRGNRDFNYVRDRIETDEICQLFMGDRRYPRVTILRPCGIYRRGGMGPLNSYLDQKIVPTFMGYDPMFQIIFEEDMLEALHLAIKKDVEGIFNIGGALYDPLSEIIKQFGKIRLSLPEPILRSTMEFFWKTKLLGYFPFDLDYVKFSFAIDDTKARQVLGFEPKFTL